MSGYRVLLSPEALDAATFAVQVNATYHPSLGPAAMDQEQRMQARLAALAALGRAKPDLTADLIEALEALTDAVRGIAIPGDQLGFIDANVTLRDPGELLTAQLQATALLARVKGER